MGLKIAILGTRGIPNYYGGFEQFAQYLSTGLVEKGHEVWVYNSHSHPHKDSTWNGVNLIHKFDPENRIGTAGQFIYDLNCILDSRKRNFDLILQLGYTSSSIWGPLLPSSSVVVTNMDGLEWKRTKYSKKVRHFLKWAEKLGVRFSDYLISDSLGIQKHLKDKYGFDSEYIPYGSHLFNNPNEYVLKEYGIKKWTYDMLVARIEPENNIETIINGFHNSNSKRNLLVIGDCSKNHFGRNIFSQFSSDKRIKFLGTIYDINVLNNFRYYSNLYFHGHSVGGTNPSLLEAMGSNALIVAHDNIFNKSILNENAFYFANSNDITHYIENIDKGDEQKKLESNCKAIKTTFGWDSIINSYEKYLVSCKEAQTIV